MVDNIEEKNIPFEDLKKILRSKGNKAKRSLKWGPDSEEWIEFRERENQRLEDKNIEPLEDLNLWVETYNVLRYQHGIRTVEGLAEILRSGRVPVRIGLARLEDIQNRFENGPQIPR